MLELLRKHRWTVHPYYSIKFIAFMIPVIQIIVKGSEIYISMN